MGLDTTAYQYANHFPGYQPEDEWDPEDGVLRVFAYSGFERALDGMEGRDRTFDLSGRGDLAAGGEWYRVGGEVDGLHCSYGTHYAFRAELAAAQGFTFEELVASPEGAAQHIRNGVAFMDLINFADNEGTLGSVACARLSQDFASHANVRRRLTSRSQELWDDWKRCADLAANTGLIDFH